MFWGILSQGITIDFIRNQKFYVILGFSLKKSNSSLKNFLHHLLVPHLPILGRYLTIRAPLHWVEYATG